MAKLQDGNVFKAIVPIQPGQKIEFKFIVDGDWKSNPDYPIETDAQVSPK